MAGGAGVLAGRGLDPEAYPDEDDVWSLDAPGLTEAELAEIREAAAAAAPVAAGDPDPARVARAPTAQAAAASARRRGPGQPGSMRHLARESSGRAAAFGTGSCLDVMPACPELALLADRAAGHDDSYAGASDDELTGCCAPGTGWSRTWRRASWPRPRSCPAAGPSSRPRRRAGRPVPPRRTSPPTNWRTCWPCPAAGPGAADGGGGAGRQAARHPGRAARRDHHLGQGLVGVLPRGVCHKPAFAGQHSRLWLNP
jgi:hypothetical protein